MDVIIAVDHTAAIDAHRARIADQLPLLAPNLESYDLHLVVVSTDPTAPLPNAPLIDLALTDGRHLRSFEGDLAAQLVAQADLDTVSGTHQPLAAIERALAIPGFARSDAGLSVIVIAARDDASPGTPEDYAPLFTRYREPGQAWAAVVRAGDAPTPRLDVALASYEDRRTAPIDADWLAVPGWAIPLVGYGCFGATPLDLDPSAEGIQASCTAQLTIDGDARDIPSCSTGAPAPCWTIESRNYCTDGQPSPTFQIRRPLVDLPYATLYAECEVTD